MSCVRQRNIIMHIRDEVMEALGIVAFSQFLWFLVQFEPIVLKLFSAGEII